MEKLKEFVHFIIDRTSSCTFTGIVKLHKSILYSNIEYAKKFGKPLIELNYIKKPQGPVCVELPNVLGELIIEGKIKQQRHQINIPGKKCNKMKKVQQVVFTSCITPLFHYLTLEDVYPITHILDKFNTMSSVQASKYSHKKGEGHGEVWQAAKLDEILPFRAYLIEDRIPDETEVESILKKLKL